MIVFKTILASIRLAIFTIALIITYPLFVLSIKTIIKYNIKTGFKFRRYFLKFINPVLGIRDKIEGVPPVQPAIYVSNHRGVLDFFVTLKYLNAYILSKAEVRDIPVLGKASELTGIFFVDREDKNSRKKTRKAIKDIIDSGENVLIFVEGTTNVNKLTAEFKIGTFEVAAQNNIPVVPVAEEYKYKDDLWKDTTTWQQFVKTTGKCFTDIKLAFGPVLQSDDPHYLMEESKKWIDNKLLEMQDDWSKAYE